MAEEGVAAQARRLLEPGATLAGAEGDLRALAWALTDITREAFAREPAVAVRAAEVLRDLAGRHPEAAPEMAALARRAAGVASLAGGRMAEALEHLDAAAAALRGFGLDDAAVQTELPKIMALSMLGRHDEAVACGVAALTELQRLGNLAAAARVSHNLGSLQLRRDAYEAAAAHYRQAAELFGRLGDDGSALLAEVGVADALTSLGRFDDARRLYASARQRAQRGGFGFPAALVDESDALLDLARGRYREALAGLESARRRYASLGMPQYMAVAEKLLGDTYLELRLLPEALALFDTAVTQFRALELPDEQAWALTQRGRAQALLEDDAADASFAAAAALFGEAGNVVGAASIELARAEIALGRGEAEAAAAGAARAAEAFSRAGQVDGGMRAEVIRAQALLEGGRVEDAAVRFQSTLARADEGAQLQVQVRCLTGLGRTALAQGRRKLAAERFESAIELFEEQRRTLPGDEMRSAFLGEHLRPYEERVRLALADGRGADVLRELDRYRARSLDERLAEGAAAAEDAETLRLRERLNWLYRRVQRLQEEAADTQALAEEMRQAERQLLERARRQRLAAGVGPAEARPAFDASALPAALGAGEALVEYGALDGRLFACVATRDGVTLIDPLSDTDAVADAVAAARFQLDALRHGAAPISRHLDLLTQRARARLARLHALLWAPLAPALTGCRRVLLVPHGVLGLVPFGALADGGPPIGQTLDLALAPSARAALRGLQQAPRSPKHVLAFGETTRLERTAHEARFVAGLFEGGRAFVGSEATVAALRRHGGEADVLHLACHAVFRQDNPRFSMLHLADGALSADEAETLALPASTVVLSACETGLAELGRGDEMVGLVRAFLVAGAARVVASQWPVDDAVTESFMAVFYRHLTAGGGAAAALRAAQAATMATHPHPAFWGAFSLWGGL